MRCQLVITMTDEKSFPTELYLDGDVTIVSAKLTCQDKQTGNAIYLKGKLSSQPQSVLKEAAGLLVENLL